MKVESMIGKSLGAALIAGATLAVWFWPKPAREAPPPEPVRPVKSLVVADARAVPDLAFAATVRAENRRVMVFKQSGRIQRIPVQNGTRVKKGDKLAWLDPTDYQNKLNVALANAEKNRLTYERRKAAFKMHGVSQEDVSQAEAAMKSTDAAVGIAKLALEETVLYAPFDGVVAKVIAEELEMVNIMTGVKHVMIVQDDANVKVDALMPETFVIQWNRLALRNAKGEASAFVTFDASPETRYPVTFREFETTSEKNASQTYKATFLMKKPDDLLLLPGMSATLVLPGSNYVVRAAAGRGCVEVPEAALGAASDGSHYVCVLEPTPEADVFTARRRTVTCLGSCTGGTFVSEGLKAGERIATAGVSLLVDGRKVSLLKDRTAK